VLRATGKAGSPSALIFIADIRRGAFGARAAAGELALYASLRQGPVLTAAVPTLASIGRSSSVVSA